jgi:hypothetical protein
MPGSFELLTMCAHIAAGPAVERLVEFRRAVQSYLPVGYRAEVLYPLEFESKQITRHLGPFSWTLPATTQSVDGCGSEAILLRAMIEPLGLPADSMDELMHNFEWLQKQGFHPKMEFTERPDHRGVNIRFQSYPLDAGVVYFNYAQVTQITIIGKREPVAARRSKRVARIPDIYPSLGWCTCAIAPWCWDSDGTLQYRPDICPRDHQP